MLRAVLFSAALLSAPVGPDAGNWPSVSPQPDSLTAFAKAWVAVNEVRDKAYAELANPRNKKVEDQAKLRDQLRKDIAATLKAMGFTQQSFDRMTQLVSSDDVQRKSFDALIAELTTRKPAPPEDHP